MDSCAPSSSTPPAAAEGMKCNRAAHSSAKPFPFLHAAAAAAAAASSKPRKPSASSSKPSARLHPPSSKIPASRKADIEPAVILQGLPSPKSGEKPVTRDEVLRKEKAVVKDEASKNEKGLVTDEALQEEKLGIEDEALKNEKVLVEEEAVGAEKAVTNDGALGEEMTIYNEALRKAGDQSDVSPLQEIKQNDIAEKEETKGDDCTEIKDPLAEKEEKKGDRAETYVTEISEESLVAAGCQKDGAPFDQKEKDAVPLVVEKEGTNTENALTKFLKIPAQQGSSSPLAETKTVVYSEQNPKFSACTGQTVSGCLKQKEGELHVKPSGRGLIFTEHLDSEQEGFLFAKGEPIFKESIQSSESLPEAECSTLKKFKEQDVSSLSQFEAAVITASDLKVAPSATVLNVACNAISSVPSPEATGFMEAAMVALAKDVLAAKCPPLQNVQLKSVALSCPWKLPRRVFVILSLVVPALLCLRSAVIQDESSYLRPT